MIKLSATRLVTAIVLVGGLTIAPLLNVDQPADELLNSEVLPQTPEFEVRWQRGQLTLSGHTQSTRHEGELRATAGSAYPSNTVVTHFNPLGIVPPYWSNVSRQVVALLATTESARAHLMVTS